MSEEKGVKEKKTNPKQERVSLDDATVAKVDQWLDQIVSQLPGIKMGRSEVVRWLVNTHSEKLTAEELREIKERNFDEMEFALWMVRRLKESKARGEKVALTDLLAGFGTIRSTKKPTRKPPELAHEDDKNECTNGSSPSPAFDSWGAG